MTKEPLTLVSPSQAASHKRIQEFEDMKDDFQDLWQRYDLLAECVDALITDNKLLKRLVSSFQDKDAVAVPGKGAVQQLQDARNSNPD